MQNLVKTFARAELFESLIKDVRLLTIRIGDVAPYPKGTHVVWTTSQDKAGMTL